MLDVIVTSHIRLGAIITVFRRDAEHRIEGRVDHRSRPDGNIYQHMIKLDYIMGS